MLWHAFRWFKIMYYLSVLTGRYVSGRPLKTRRTNSTYLEPATVTYGKQPASRWELLAGWQRQAVRLAAPPLTLCFGCNALESPRTSFGLLFVALTGVLLWRHQGWLRSLEERRHRRRYVVPIVKALERILKIRAARMSDLVYVPRDWLSNPSAYVGVALPDGDPLTETTRKRVEHAVRGKLGITDWSAEWQTVGNAPRVIFRRPLRVPAFCDFWLALDVIRSLPAGTVLLGAEAGGRHHTLNLDSDYPHVAATGETGSGKTVLACIIAVQVLMHGGRVVILDIKGSHQWARDLIGSGVTYARKIEEVHDMWVAIGAEAERRRDVAWDSRGAAKHARLLVVFEELGSTLEALADHWQAARERDEPKLSPAISAYRAVLAMGRSVCVNVLVAAQALTAAAAGGTERRENIGARYGARWKAGQWAYLFGKVPMPVDTRHPGRWWTVRSGQPVEFQLLFPGEDSDRETQLRLADVVVSHLRRRVPVEQVFSGATATPNVAPVAPSAAPTEPPMALPAGSSGPPMGLRLALDTGLIDSPSVDAARRRIQRAGDRGPNVVGVAPGTGEKLYDPDQLRAFFAKGES